LHHRSLLNYSPEKQAAKKKNKKQMAADDQGKLPDRKRIN
jgi:hypothetical protein